MAQEFRALAALPDGPMFSSKHSSCNSQLFTTPGNLIQSCGLRGHCICAAHRHTWRQSIHIHKININQSKPSLNVYLLSVWMCMWKLEGDLEDSMLSLHHVISREWTQSHQSWWHALWFTKPASWPIILWYQFLSVILLDDKCTYRGLGDLRIYSSLLWSLRSRSQFVP